MARRKYLSPKTRKRNMPHSENQAASKKGMELPINTLVIVAIAVIVILAVAAFFMGGFSGSSRDMQNKQAFLNACSGWVQTSCNSNDASSVTNIRTTFLNWQPTKEDPDNAGHVLPPPGVTEVNYLANMCGCFGGASSGGGGSPPPPPPPTPTCADDMCGAANTVPCICGENIINTPNVWCAVTPTCPLGQGFSSQGPGAGTCITVCNVV